MISIVWIERLITTTLKIITSSSECTTLFFYICVATQHHVLIILNSTLQADAQHSYISLGIHGIIEEIQCMNAYIQWGYVVSLYRRLYKRESIMVATIPNQCSRVSNHLWETGWNGNIYAAEAAPTSSQLSLILHV